jgi:hypothetical protein
MTLRTRLKFSIIIVMFQCWAVPQLTGWVAVLNAVALLVNCAFLGAYIKEATK